MYRVNGFHNVQAWSKKNLNSPKRRTGRRFETVKWNEKVRRVPSICRQWRNLVTLVFAEKTKDYDKILKMLMSHNLLYLKVIFTNDNYSFNYSHVFMI